MVHFLLGTSTLSPELRLINRNKQLRQDLLNQYSGLGVTTYTNKSPLAIATFLRKITFLGAGSFFVSFLVSFPTGAEGGGEGCFAAELDLSRPTE